MAQSKSSAVEGESAVETVTADKAIVPPQREAEVLEGKVVTEGDNETVLVKIKRGLRNKKVITGVAVAAMGSALGVIIVAIANARKSDEDETTEV